MFNRSHDSHKRHQRALQLQKRLRQVQTPAQNVQPPADQVERPGRHDGIGAAAQNQTATQFGIKAATAQENLIRRIHPQVQAIAWPAARRCRAAASLHRAVTGGAAGG